jgi:hypothetical protein
MSAAFSRLLARLCRESKPSLRAIIADSQPKGNRFKKRSHRDGDTFAEFDAPAQA